MDDAGTEGAMQAVRLKNWRLYRFEQIREDRIEGENLTSDSKKVIYPLSES